MTSDKSVRRDYRLLPMTAATAWDWEMAADSDQIYGMPNEASAIALAERLKSVQLRGLQQAHSGASSNSSGTAKTSSGGLEALAPYGGCGTQDVKCLQANRPSCPARAYQGFDGFVCPSGQYCAKAS